MGLVILIIIMSQDTNQSEFVSYSYLDAAEKVLDAYAHKSPMHYKEITRLALEKDWIISNAKDPARSMYASISQDTKKEAPSRFVLDKRTGMISLVKWGNAALINKVDDHNKRQREEILTLLRGMEPGKFESFVAEVVLPAMGFEECAATQRSRDGGVDAVGQLVIHNSVRVNVAVQIKRYKETKVSCGTVRGLRGSLKPGQQGVIITTSEYSRDARKEADDIAGEKPRISLLDGKDIVDLLVDMDWENWEGNEKGIEVKHLKMIQVNKKFFTEFGNTPNAESISSS